VSPRAGLDVLENRKVSVPTDIGTPDRPTLSLYTIPNTLPRLSSEYAQDVFKNVHTLYVFSLTSFTDPVRYPMDRGVGGPQRASRRSEEDTKYLMSKTNSCRKVAATLPYF